jgi:hypothetical protein
MQCLPELAMQPAVVFEASARQPSFVPPKTTDFSIFFHQTSVDLHATIHSPVDVSMMSAIAGCIS